MKINVVLSSDIIRPVYSTSGSAGMDLRAWIDNRVDGTVTIQPHSRVLIGTGVKMEIPLGYEGQLRSRSGLAYKHGIRVFHSPCTIDCDYRGEIFVLLENTTDTSFDVNTGDRIAQLVISRYYMADLVDVDELSDTNRGSGGFGSTGSR